MKLSFILLRSLLTDNPASPGKVGHTTRVYVPYSFRTVRSDVGSLMFHKNRADLKSNHLQMSLHRKYFLLSYLKTLSVGPARV